MSHQHKNPENEHFAKIELEKTAKLRDKLSKENRRATLEERKAAYWMRCGKCGGMMEPQIFKGLEIDVCPECGAVLLDPGELEALAGPDNSGFFKDLASLFRPGGK